MKVAVYSTKAYDRHFLAAANSSAGHELHFLEMRLSLESAALAQGSTAICAFVNDDLGRLGVGLVALRSAGFNNVDFQAARALGSASPGCRPTPQTQLPSTPSR